MNLWNKSLLFFAKLDLSLALREVDWVMGKGFWGPSTVWINKNIFRLDINDVIRFRRLEAKHVEEDLELIEKHIEEIENFRWGK